MFALGFLVAVVVFAILLVLVSKAFPPGRPRVIFVLCVLGAIAVYPFLYKVTPSYAAFLELCEAPGRVQLGRRQPVDYVLLEGGSATFCERGPALIADRPYLGFDCLRAGKPRPALVRYARKPDWHAGCGLECFDATPLAAPEAPYEWKYRSGKVAGRVAIVTYDGTGDRVASPKEPPDEKLSFSDRVLWSGGEIGFARDYTYFPYGEGWAKILGLASGSAPSKRCRVPIAAMDVRDAFPPKASR